MSPAAEPAGEQGKFWELYDHIFAEQDELNTSDVNKTRSKLDELAKSLKLDMKKFTAAFQGKPTLERFGLDDDLGLDIAVQQTPSSYGTDQNGNVTALLSFEQVKEWVDKSNFAVSPKLK